MYVEFDVRPAIPVCQRQWGVLKPEDCYWVQRSLNGEVDIAIIAFEFIGQPSPTINSNSPTHPARPYIRLRSRFNSEKDLDNQLDLPGHHLGQPQSSTSGVAASRIYKFQDKASIRYNNDTWGGSSGTPVFNKSWELVAVHHGGGTEWNQGTTCTAIVRLLREDRKREEAAIATDSRIAKKWKLLDECLLHLR